MSRPLPKWLQIGRSSFCRRQFCKRCRHTRPQRLRTTRRTRGCFATSTPRSRCMLQRGSLPILDETVRRGACSQVSWRCQNQDHPPAPLLNRRRRRRRRRPLALLLRLRRRTHHLRYPYRHHRLHHLKGLCPQLYSHLFGLDRRASSPQRFLRRPRELFEDPACTRAGAVGSILWIED